MSALNDAPDWKSAFYAAYVSSGQAVDTGEPAEAMFRPRMAYLNGLIASHIPPDRNIRILDLACGPGALLYALGRAGYADIAGVDVSEEQIAVARRMGIATATCNSLEGFLDEQDAGSVDVVTAIDILEHLTRAEIMGVLASIRRVLKPGGRCVAHVPNAEGLFGMQIRFGDITHELAFTQSSAAQVFRVAGFSQVRCFEDNPRVHGVKSLVRRVLWELGTLQSRVLSLAETGSGGAILSRNMVIEAIL
jgi:SAM-dependent methyltransferase